MQISVWHFILSTMNYVKEERVLILKFFPEALVDVEMLMTFTKIVNYNKTVRFTVVLFLNNMIQTCTSNSLIEVFTKKIHFQLFMQDVVSFPISKGQKLHGYFFCSHSNPIPDGEQ